jgi:hypothetical protein
MIPNGYYIEETSDQVKDVKPEMLTRFKRRANRRCRKMNRLRQVPFYRYEVYETASGRWVVVAMQNRLVPVD